ncbi:DNA polymerase III subunit beta (plasmid) [Leptolyngbya sp. BL0902]|uniref:DNA polymerase III subunit beta n=1 Tax=Leptolyngbya sp. BL0902 TaxID=1115757 RepID=UPI0018E6E79A|nr:DNA polymerase III subunit beta [Leptolyngbya sp. BL0902]QQE67364.1 DNA polymerase III subunit beta [Leptolyngbya sp. BL0902]
MPTQTRQTKPKATPESGQPEPKSRPAKATTTPKATQTGTSSTKAKTRSAKSSQAKTSQTKATQTEAPQADAKPAKTRSAKTAQADAHKTQAKPNPTAPVAFSITALQSHLSTLLSTVAPAIQANPTNPILSYLKIEALDGACRITATDTSYTITATAECDTLHPGVGLLPAQLAQVIQAIPASETLALVGSTVEEATKIELSNPSGVISTTPISLSVDQFLMAELTHPESHHTLPAETLKLALQTVLGSAGAKDKAVLHGVHLTVEGHTVVCEATDGHQIAMASMETQTLGRRRRQAAESEPVDCRIPLDTVKALIKLLTQAAKDSDVGLRLETGEAPKAQFQIQTDTAHVTLTCHCLAEAYPNIQQVIQPFTYGTSALVNRTSLLHQAQVIKAMGAKTPVAKLTLSDAHLHLSMDGNAVSGTQTVQAALDMPDPTFETALNLDLLINLARSATGEQLRLEFGSPESLIKLSPVASDLEGLGVVGYMMPVRILSPDKAQ